MEDYKDQPSSQKQQTINLRLYERNIPSQTLQPYLDSRPVMTKYSILPIVDLRQPIQTQLIQQSTYSPNYIFNPGNDTAPWSGYSSNINQESELRNQIFAIQSCPQSQYIPSSKSSLYHYQFNNHTNIQQPFQNLFNTDAYFINNDNSNNSNNFYNSNKIGPALFNNATRQQLKELNK